MHLIDYSSKERSIARVCCGSKDNPGVRFLNKQGWLDGTIEPYRGFYEKPDQYVEKVLKKISSKLDKKALFGLMFLAGDLSRKKSLSDAAKFCHWYDEKNVPGSTYCVMNIKDIPSGNAEELLDFFNFHDQVFIIRKKGFFKIHLSEESIHKLFLS